MANAPVTTLEVAQMGIETTRGTLVPATTIMDMDPGGATLIRTPTIITVRNAGSLSTSHRNYPGRDVIQIDFAGAWTYNWAPNWLNLFFGPLAAGVGAGTDKVWAFAGGTVISDTADNLKSASIELGGRDTWPSEYKIAGCVGHKLELHVTQDKVWTYKATLLGQAVTLGAKTAALSTAASIVDVLGTTSKGYVDSASAFGTTQKVGSLISADVIIENGLVQRWTQDGQRNPFRVAVTGPRKVSAKVVLEYNAQAEYTATHAATAQRVRLISPGPVLGGSSYNWQIDLGGVWDTFTIGKDGDVITEDLNLKGAFDSSLGVEYTASVTNATPALL